MRGGTRPGDAATDDLREECVAALGRVSALSPRARTMLAARCAGLVDAAWRAAFERHGISRGAPFWVAFDAAGRCVGASRRTAGVRAVLARTHEPGPGPGIVYVVGSRSAIACPPDGGAFAVHPGPPEAWLAYLP